ncbi:hypothetical protein AAFF_G00123870 [Aldrovandia affinis]|uniref:Protein phosphatase 1 regulatory subunit 27 n=1 Tax=Aldrovandia affinis TaxID=143900 RepID=A0AAD7RUE7_9TELE|nr:hypothetical protein AAFF_G00123870 [Aldrovandia affinis]
MKYSLQYLVSEYTQSNHYKPTHYTPTHYTPTHYTPARYTQTHYTPTRYTPADYTPALYTPKQSTAKYSTAALYTPTSYTPASYTPVSYTPTRHTASSLLLKPARAVHFSNDVVFQDHVRHGDLDQIGRFLRARKVRLDTIFHSGMAALHEAVLSGNLECVKLLVKYGADVHQRDEDGWTALHMACSDSYPEIARYLLSLGASTVAENECGEKPADLIDPECKELAKLFENQTREFPTHSSRDRTKSTLWQLAEIETRQGTVI